MTCKNYIIWSGDPETTYEQLKEMIGDSDIDSFLDKNFVELDFEKMFKRAHIAEDRRHDLAMR